MKPGTAYFRLCHAMFVVACVVGGSCALSYLNLVKPHDWATWRPLLGIALLFTSMVLSFVGYARMVRANSQPSSPSNLAIRQPTVPIATL